jgi:hypothetical protein
MSGEPITTMASIRRRAVKGTRLEVVAQTKRPVLVGTIRTITNPRSLSSRLYEFTSDHTADTLHVGGWPKASEVRIIDADTFEYDIHPGPGIVRLRFLPAETYGPMRTDDRLDTRRMTGGDAELLRRNWVADQQDQLPPRAIALTGIVGMIVIRLGDDTPCPLTGRVTDRIDEEWVRVAWGAEQHEADPRSRVEPFDDLSPFPGRTPD